MTHTHTFVTYQLNKVRKLVLYSRKGTWQNNKQKLIEFLKKQFATIDYEVVLIHISICNDHL